MSVGSGAATGEVLSSSVFFEARAILQEARSRLSLLGFDAEEIIPTPSAGRQMARRRAVPPSEAAWRRDPASSRFMF